MYNITNWQAPQNLAELTACLQQKTAQQKLVAGGTDLLIALKNQPAGVNGLIDLSRVKELQHIEQQANQLRIGSLVTYDQLANHPLVRKQLTALAQAAASVGSQQIRNRGTIGGGVVNASPASDIVPVLFALQAQAELLDSRGNRSLLPIAQLVIGAGKTVLAANQCILAFILPLTENSISKFVKLGSRSQVTIAQITATLWATPAAGTAADCRLYLGSVAPVPLRLPAAEQLLIGQTIGALPQAQLDRCIALFAQYIAENVPREFDRDYKKLAIKGVLYDLLGAEE